MKSIFLRLAFLFLIVAKSLFSFAEEGMLIPSLIAAFESDMKAKGMKLSAADIYSVNNASLKDAIMHFGGGCTAELVSSQGLLLTNHHCGYGQIQSHSSLEHDYLKNGFWAKDKSAEMKPKSLYVRFFVRMDDVSKRILSKVNDKMTEAERNKAIQQEMALIEKVVMLIKRQRKTFKSTEAELIELNAVIEKVLETKKNEKNI